MDPSNPRSYQALSGLKAEHLPQGLLHRKTWNAATAANSKRMSQLPSPAELTDDWSVRGRVNCATVLSTTQGPIDLQAITNALTEFCIPQRGWDASEGFTGDLPRYVLTVENLSPFVDLKLPPNCIVLFSQGAAVDGAAQVLRGLPEASWMHFGDLDAAGIQICQRLASLADRSPKLYVPSFAHEYQDRRLQAKETWSFEPFDDPILRYLSKHTAWLEQEIFILDPRLEEDLNTQFQLLGSP